MSEVDPEASDPSSAARLCTRPPVGFEAAEEVTRRPHGRSMTAARRATPRAGTSGRSSGVRSSPGTPRHAAATGVPRYAGLSRYRSAPLTWARAWNSSLQLTTHRRHCRLTHKMMVKELPYSDALAVDAQRRSYGRELVAVVWGTCRRHCGAVGPLRWARHWNGPSGSPPGAHATFSGGFFPFEIAKSSEGLNSCSRAGDGCVRL